ncbi:MAG: HD domain-containing protein [Bacteroides sp.]
MVKIDEDLYKKALDFATSKHEGQTRIEGKPYITHPVAVAQIVRDWGYGTDYVITALFHDLLEDTDATEDEIAAIGGPEVLEAVILLTKKKGYVMSEYTKAIRENKIAFVVKAADRLHNLRSAIYTDTDFKRRYILETVDWYLDFSPEIPEAVQSLVKSLDTPLTELPFLYEPIDTWKISSQNINP